MVKKKKQEPLIKLDLSHGELPEGHAYIRIPKLDPYKFPWPLKDESVEEAFSGFLFHRVPAKLRGKFMDELWRVLIPEGKATIIVPYWSSPRAIQEASCEWPPICEQTFLYYNKQFRDINKERNTCTCNFEAVAGYALDPDTQNRNDETRPFWIRHYLNTVNDLHITLTKKI